MGIWLWSAWPASQSGDLHHAQHLPTCKREAIVPQRLPADVQHNPCLVHCRCQLFMNICKLSIGSMMTSSSLPTERSANPPHIGPANAHTNMASRCRIDVVLANYQSRIDMLSTFGVRIFAVFSESLLPPHSHRCQGTPRSERVK